MPENQKNARRCTFSWGRRPPPARGRRRAGRMRSGRGRRGGGGAETPPPREETRGGGRGGSQGSRGSRSRNMPLSYFVIAQLLGYSKEPALRPQLARRCASLGSGKRHFFLNNQRADSAAGGEVGHPGPPGSPGSPAGRGATPGKLAIASRQRGLLASARGPRPPISAIADQKPLWRCGAGLSSEVFRLCSTQ